MTVNLARRIAPAYKIGTDILHIAARCVMSTVKKETAEELTALLTRQNPGLDIRLENILTEKAFKEYTQETFAHLQ